MVNNDRFFLEIRLGPPSWFDRKLQPVTVPNFNFVWHRFSDGFTHMAPHVYGLSIAPVIDSKHLSAAFTNLRQVVNVDGKQLTRNRYTQFPRDTAGHTAPFELRPIHHHSLMALRHEVVDPSQNVPRYPVSLQFPE